MTNLKKRTRNISGRTFGSVLALAGGLLTQPVNAADLMVEMNQSRLHQLPSAASTIIVGNPAIADVSVSNSSTLVVFGRSYGRTNLIALDADGRQIANLDLNVVEATDTAMIVNRGVGQQSYNCTPRCVRVINSNDDGEATAALVTTARDVSGFNDQAAAAASGQQ